MKKILHTNNISIFIETSFAPYLPPLPLIIIIITIIITTFKDTNYDDIHCLLLVFSQVYLQGLW